MHACAPALQHKQYEVGVGALTVAVGIRLLAGLYTTQRRFMWKPPRGMPLIVLVYLIITVVLLCVFVYAAHVATKSLLVLYCGYILAGCVHVQRYFARCVCAVWHSRRHTSWPVAGSRLWGGSSSASGVRTGTPRPHLASPVSCECHALTPCDFSALPHRFFTFSQLVRQVRRRGVVMRAQPPCRVASACHGGGGV